MSSNNSEEMPINSGKVSDLTPDVPPTTMEYDIKVVDASHPTYANTALVSAWLTAYYCACTGIDPGIIKGIDVGAINSIDIKLGSILGAILGVPVGLVAGKIIRKIWFRGM